MNLRKIIHEAVNDFEWAEDVPTPIIYVGLRFTLFGGNTVFTVKEIMGNNLIITWGEKFVTYTLEDCLEDFHAGNLKPLNDSMNESNDFEWADEIPLPTAYVGLRFTALDEPKVYTISHVDETTVHISWDDVSIDYPLEKVEEFLLDGVWKPLNDTMTESNDFEWADEISAPSIYVGLKFRPVKSIDRNVVFTITKIENDGVTVSWLDDYGQRVYSNAFKVKEAIDSVENGNWEILDDTITESDDFDWTDDIEAPIVYVGLKFTVSGNNTVFTVEGFKWNDVIITWVDKENGWVDKENGHARYPIKDVIEYLTNGDWLPVNDTITESNDFEWADSIEAPILYIGLRFTDEDENRFKIFTVISIEGDDVIIGWENRRVRHPIEDAIWFLTNGVWVPIDNLHVGMCLKSSNTGKQFKVVGLNDKTVELMSTIGQYYTPLLDSVLEDIIRGEMTVCQ